MRLQKIGISVLFLSSSVLVFGQKTKTDSAKSEKKLEGVTLQGKLNKKSETATILQQKKADVQVQAIGAEEISRKGITNVEQSLIRLTGITNVEGKGLFVRGLEERYNTLLINGLGTPSNNPFQKIIALKQFPTDVVGKLNVYKTFNSNLYADFAGATFDIETLTYEKPYSKIEFSVGVNSQNTFRNGFRISKNANTIEGFIGLNSKDRQLPSEVKGFRPSNYNFSAAQSLNSFKDSWDVDKIKSLPNTSLSFTTAQRIKMKNSGTLGLLFSLNQSSSYEIYNGEKNQFLNNGPEIIYNNKLNKKQYEYETESSVLLGLGYKKRGTNIALNGMFLQNASNIIQDLRGYLNQERNNPQFIRTNQLDISRFTDLQLTASQKINDRNFISAGASWVNNQYQQPDRKIFSGTPSDGQANTSYEINLNYGGNNLIRQYLDVDGKNYFSAFAEYKLGLGDKGSKKEFPIEIALGYNGYADIRSTSYRFIFSNFNDVTQRNVTVNADSPQSVFDQSIKAGNLFYKEGSTSVYKNNMYQFVNAGYLNINYRPNETWDILLGGRVENNMNITRYKTFEEQFNDKFINLDRNQYFILPSLSIKKEVNDKTNLRFAASKTITRPILIEYMPIEYINPNNETIFGNPNLKNSENYNLDLKYEVFPSKNELFSINLFAKRIDNAIERAFIASGNSNGQTITFFNAKKANLAGAEIEGIISLKRFSESLERFTFGFNTTLLYSDVERSDAQKQQESENQRNKKRGLQGAAPWTVNGDLKYAFKNSKNLEQTASLVYNVSGSKIHTLATNGLDNIYERPFSQLDFVYNAEISKNWSAKFSILNLLNSEYKLEMGDKSDVAVNTDNRIYENYYRGTNFKLSIGYTF